MTPFNKNEKEKFKALSIPRHIYLLITFLILLAIGGLAYGLYVGYYFPVCYGNLLNTVQKMHHETTMGHLCFEELLNSDSRTDLQEVVDHYSKAYRYSQVMLKKESHDKLDLLPLSEKNLRHRISAIQAKLEELKKISRQLQAEVGSLGPDSVKNNNYDALYNELLNHTALVTEDLQGVTAEKRKTFCVTLSLLIAVILLLALILFILVRKFERRRAQAYVDLKKTQEQLRESEERYRSLIENIDLGIVLVDADCRIIMANQAQADLFDVRLDDLLDKKCHEIFFQGGEEHCDLCPVNRAKEEEGAVEECLEIERIDGSRFRARIKVFPFQSSNQNGGFIKVTEDITDRLQTEEALAAEKERLAVTLRSIGDGVITTDTEGKVTMINKVAEDLTGWPQHEAEGRPLIEVFRIINELTRAVCDNPVEKVLSSGRIVGLANHTALISRDGTQRTIADSGSPIRDHQSRIIGVVLVFRDVTRQLQMEKEITKVKKLESIGVLAGGIAHDFNNILTGILGNLNLALFDGNMEKGTRKLLTEAEKASVRAKALTAQLLTFSQGGEPIKETASFEEVIRDSVEFILHGDRVAAKFDIPEDLWLVDIDKGQMSQVVQNLVLNASHAMPEGGLIEITGENIHTISDEHIFLASDQKYIKITITDYGIGIPESFVEKIFDPYFSTKQEGSGLGLPISYSIINKHGGHILVDSKTGVGTTFTIYLPASRETCAEQEDKEKHRQGPEFPARIMVMDDEDIIRDMSKTMLKRLGHEVILAGDGREAINLYKEQEAAGKPVDLIIMDLTIPGGMGGRETIQEILAINPGARVIVSSGYSNDPVMSNYREYGFKAVIFKPYKLQELKKVVNQVLF